MTRNKPKKANKITILSTLYPFWLNDNLYICNIFKYRVLLPTEHHKHQTIKFNNKNIEPLSKLSESESTVSRVELQSTRLSLGPIINAHFIVMLMTHLFSLSHLSDI